MLNAPTVALNLPLKNNAEYNKKVNKIQTSYPCPRLSPLVLNAHYHGLRVKEWGSSKLWSTYGSTAKTSGEIIYMFHKR